MKSFNTYLLDRNGIKKFIELNSIIDSKDNLIQIFSNNKKNDKVQSIAKLLNDLFPLSHLSIQNNNNARININITVFDDKPSVSNAKNDKETGVFTKLITISKKINERNTPSELFDVFSSFATNDLRFQKCLIFKHNSANGWFNIVNAKGYETKKEMQVIKIISLLLSGEIIEYLRTKKEPIIHTYLKPNDKVKKLAASLFLEECYFELIGGSVDVPYSLAIVGNSVSNSKDTFCDINSDSLLMNTLSHLTLHISKTINNSIFYKAWTDEKALLEQNILSRTKEIREQKNSFEKMYYGSKEAIGILDMDSKFLSVNPAYTELTKFTAEELLNLNCLGLTAPKDIEKSKIAMKEVIEVGYIKNFVKDCIIKNGEIITVEMSMSVLLNPQRILISARDITKEKKIRHDLLNANKQILLSNNAKSEFIATMSHEIRTPLNGIIGMSYLALETNLNEKQKNYITKIAKSAKSLLFIINDILDFSKLEAGKLSVEKIPFDLNDTILNTLELIEYQANEKKLKLNVYYGDEISKILLGDPLRLSQILTNLLSNAVKFTENGHIDLLINKINSNRYSFEVRDTGIGISKDAQKKLFKPFSQADGSTTRKFGGTGLGLSIVSQLVDIMNGKIILNSTPGAGSSFIFDIELEEASDNSILNENNLNTISKVSIDSLAGNRILLAEDNSINRDVIASLLSTSGITLDFAYDGSMALDMYKANSDAYDLILMDIQMPVMNGYEATSEIRKINNEIPIIAISANAMTEDIQKSKDNGMNDHISKPIDVDVFYTILLEYMKTKFIINKSFHKKIIDNVSKINDEISFTYIDVKLGMKHLGGNKKQYMKTLEDFLDKYSNIDIDTILDTEYVFIIHTIKGVSGTIGASFLYDATKELEKSKTEENIEKFKIELAKVILELKDKLIKSENKFEEKQDVAPEYISKLFRLLKESVVTKRPKNCNYIVDEIAKYNLIKKHKDFFEQSKEFLKKYKFDEIEELLKGL